VGGVPRRNANCRPRIRTQSGAPPRDGGPCGSNPCTSAGVPVAYIAYTERHVLMLDGEGVCIRVEPLSGRGLSPARIAGRGSPDQPAAAGSDGALRCIGAQYVASIDPGEPGGLAHLPRAGISMLFAAVDPSGRIFCVRAGPLTHFESSAADDSGVHSTPNDTQKQASLSFDDATDPGLHISLADDDAELETTPYEVVRPPSNPAPLPRSAYGRRDTPPPPPRLPRLRPFVTPVSPRPSPTQGARVAPNLGIAPRPSQYVAAAGRGRPPAPSSHAWLRHSAVAGWPRR
jgi:hypothetical protein